MTNYIVKGCPCIEDILDAHTLEVVNKDYCIKRNNDCKDISDCQMKQLINAAMLEYKTPEEMEQLQEKLNPFDYGAICAKHNMAHLIITELGVQEVE